MPFEPQTSIDLNKGDFDSTLAIWDGDVVLKQKNEVRAKMPFYPSFTVLLTLPETEI